MFSFALLIFYSKTYPIAKRVPDILILTNQILEYLIASSKQLHQIEILSTESDHKLVRAGASNILIYGFTVLESCAHLVRNNSTKESEPARYLLPIRRMVLSRGLDPFSD